MRKFQRKSSLVSYTPVGVAFFAHPEAVASGLDDRPWPIPSKPSSSEDPARTGSVSEDSESVASDLDGSEPGGSDLDDSDFDELDEDSSDPFENDDVVPLLATPGSHDPFHHTDRGNIHIRLLASDAGATTMWRAEPRPSKAYRRTLAYGGGRCADRSWRVRCGLD